MAELAIGLGTSIIGGVIQQRGESRAAEAEEAGVRQQLETEALNREFQRRQFERQLERQQPFLEAGTLALPEFIQAIQNRPVTDVAGLPATGIQAGLITEALGPQAPAFVTEGALADLSAIEAERQKGRLADLVNIGLGGVGSAAGSRVNLGTTLGSSLAGSGALQAQGLQQAAASRENRRNQLIQGLAGLPAVVAAGLPLTAQAPSPFITPQNPLGLTPGQGL